VISGDTLIGFNALRTLLTEIAASTLPTVVPRFEG
jgi:hypothetical protein